MFSTDVSGNYNDDSASGSSPTSLMPSDVLTSSTVSVEENNQPLQPFTIILSDKPNFISSPPMFVQTSPSDINPPFTSSTTMKHLVTSDIEPSSTSTASSNIESNLSFYISETLFSLSPTFPEGLRDASIAPPYSLSTTPIMKSLVKPSPHTSTETTIYSSFSDYSSEGTILSNTIPDSRSDTSIPPRNSLSTVIPTSSTLSPNTSSINRWRCKEGNVTGNNTREYIFPAIEMEDLRISLWQATQQGVSYLYHVNSSEIGCSGTVTEIRFCYRVSLNVSTEEHIFTMSIMNSSRHVLKTVEITSTPTNDSGESTTINCMNDYSNKKYCCDSMNLADDNVTFRTSEFILGIETSNSSQVRLQNFKHNVSQGVYNAPKLNGYPEINIMGKIATVLPVIRFIIRESKILNCLEHYNVRVRVASEK